MRPLLQSKVLARSFSSTNQKRHELFTKNLLEKKNQSEVTFYPRQHPKQLDSASPRIFRHDKQLAYTSDIRVTPYNENLPNISDTLDHKQPENARSLTFCLLGAPNSGKSTLFNLFLGKNISPVSNKSNTTNDKVMGVTTNEQNSTQLVLYDTPGITKTKAHSKHYITRAWDVIPDCDLLLFVYDAVKRIDDPVRHALRRLNNITYNPDADEKVDRLLAMKNIKEIEKEMPRIMTSEPTSEHVQSTYPKVLVLNKMDLCTNKKKLRSTLTEIEDLSKFEKVFYISCETGYGIEELRTYIEQKAKIRMWQYNSTDLTELSNVEICENAMRQAIFERFFRQIPHQTGVLLEGFAVRTDGVGLLNYVLDVQTDDLVKIIVGTDGRNMRILSEKVRVILVKHFKKDFIISILVKKRKHRLEIENQKTLSIMSDQQAKDELEEELENIKEQKAKLNERLMTYLGI